MTPDSFWCATACCIARPSPPRLPYLRKELRGLAAGGPWPCDYGPDLSRGFRALKTWFTLKVYGTAALGAVISRTCALARYLENRIAGTPELELFAPVELNVVCFRYRAEDAQRINPRIVIELQQSGIVAPSTTIIEGKLAIRAAIVNHRTGEKEIDLLVEKTVATGRAMLASAIQSRVHPPDGEWQARNARELALSDLKGRITANPESVSLRFELACLLAEIGLTLEAKKAYLDVLTREPSHRLALNNLGTLLHSHRISNRCSHRVRRSRGAPSRRSLEPRESGGMSCKRSASLQPRVNTTKRHLILTPEIGRRIRGSLMCWPSSVIRKARCGTAVKASRSVPSLHCRIAAKDHRCP